MKPLTRENAVFSFRKTFFDDHSVFILALIPTLLLGFYCFSFLVRLLFPENITARAVSGPYMLLIIGVLFAITVPLLALRLFSIIRLFKNGAQREGVIAEIAAARDKMRILYVYVYEGEEYANALALNKTRNAMAFTKGQSVTVYVDAKKPSRALLADAYVETNGRR